MDNSQTHTPEERATLRQAWVDTRMEKDKTLLTLSAGGVGLLVTLLTGFGARSSLQLGMFALSGVAFLIAMLTAVVVFERNAKHIEDVLNGASVGDDSMLVRLDVILMGAFLLGVVGLAVIAGESGWASFVERRAKVAESTENKGSGPDHIRSLTGISLITGNQQGAGQQGGGASGSGSQQQSGGGAGQTGSANTTGSK